MDDLAAVPAVRKVDYSGEFFAGRQGRSCDETCREKGKRCDMKGIKFANSCDVIKEHFPCKMCWKSQGSDQVRRNHFRHHPISGLVLVREGPDHWSRRCLQPCYVSMLSAPAEKHPGDCMIEGLESLNRCDGKYSMTSRLCPCI